MAVTFSKWKTPIKEQDAEVRKGNFGEVCLGYSLEEGTDRGGTLPAVQDEAPASPAALSR
ncbi:hypothetical protein [Cloacibacillus evryensis]|uniref:hypothetical protein n=1 Tax=Cloacibacillus evryensis TaxID=508460 RepID=UPI0004ADBB80